MGAHFGLELLPVKTMESVKSDHVNLVDELAVIVVAHTASEDVHLGAGGKQNSAAEVVLVERVLHVGETVQQLRGSLVVSNVNYFVSVSNVRVFNILLDCVFNRFEHSRNVLGAHFREGPVPELFSIVDKVMLSVFHGVRGTSVVAEPHVVAGFIQLDRHRLTMLRRGEPRVSGHG